ncbi:MAG: hypothetical protein II100_01305, partial [Prevotella sp.]|nr:hypothetical protein [Prevotella sp.]
ALMADEDGLYVGTDNGVFFFQFQLEKFQRIAPEIRSTVRGFSLDRDGQVWISMDGHSVFRYVPKTKQIKKYTIPSSSASMTIAYADAQNRIWAIGGNGDGMVSQLNKVKDELEPVRFVSTMAD